MGGLSRGADILAFRDLAAALRRGEVILMMRIGFGRYLYGHGPFACHPLAGGLPPVSSPRTSPFALQAGIGIYRFTTSSYS